MKIKLDKGALIPTRAHGTDAGADLRSPIETVVPARGSCIIDTGVHIQLPHGFVGMLKSKSGLNVEHGITSEGVIDEGYTGSIKVKLYNHSYSPYKIERYDKITQLVIVPCEYVQFDLVDDLEDSERGGDGFGSTGK
jgi:dUTP pyrophosphatase